MHPFEYDVIVVGGGHAGTEAAAAAARMGARTLLVTMNLQTIGQMSCNPAIGGIGKGHIVREIDALGGVMGKVTDRAGIQFRMLNQRRGPAVQGPRAQCDRVAYAAAVREELEHIPGLFMRADMAVDVCTEQGRVTGIRTQIGQTFHAPAVILTSGTFMNGVIHIGERQYGGGRMGERASTGLTACLEKLGFESGRLKTGTPPRIDGRTIDYDRLEEQPGDPAAAPFSFLTDRLPEDQVSCWIAYTSPEVHDALREGFDRSPMFAGRIEGAGPRYCPSIEDKIDRFAGKDRHQLFLEPEGRNTYEVYVNGFSTSLPEEVQFAALRNVVGLEQVHMLRPGYAIEYDYFPPYQIRYSLESGRLKTGTPPRIDGRTIDYDRLEEQPGDPAAAPFSFLTDRLPEDQVSCWIAYTSPEVHDALREGFDRSPMFAGRIEGAGPRYCPSIEDKIDRFAGKDRHQLFLEPEGRDTYEVYVNGFSTSLPEDVQFAALRNVVGLEQVHMLRPGYAIEYDYFPPYQIRYSLETKQVRGLFFAGQINGTTGYEEAGAQGLMAGINAARYLRCEDPVVLKRSEAYIGVLIDDLVAKGTDEPYRMFTSRAEHRLLLRQDNADRRLTALGHTLGLATDARYERMRARQHAIEATRKAIEATTVSPDTVNAYLEQVGTDPVRRPERLLQLAKRPQVSLDDLLDHIGRKEELVTSAPGPESAARQVEIDLRYEGYLDRERDLVRKMEEMESLRLPDDFDYEAIDHITLEAREKLSKIRPDNLGQASRISGVSPADVSVLLVMLRRRPVRKQSPSPVAT